MSGGEVIVICGSREGFDQVQVDLEMASLPDDAMVITGGARGVDRLAHSAAERFGFQTEVIHAEWERHGKKAGYLRNVEMLNREPDRVIAFWDGKSKGTLHTITEARRRSIPVQIISPVTATREPTAESPTTTRDPKTKSTNPISGGGEQG